MTADSVPCTSDKIEQPVREDYQIIILSDYREDTSGIAFLLTGYTEQE